MNVAFLTTDDPLYLPELFERILATRSAGVSVFVVPPLYRSQTSRSAAWRYFRTFGARATVVLARRVLVARLRGRSIARVCARHDVPCTAVADVNAPEFLGRLRSLETDLVVSVSCPQIFRRSLIDLPPLGCLNLHGAVLPAYRGVMPSFWMLARGEHEAGVSLFFVNEDIDGGDLCGQRVFPIERGDTLDSFLRRSKSIGADLVLEVLASVEDGTVSRTPLELEGGSYYSWPDREAVREFHAAGRRLW